MFERIRKQIEEIKENTNISAEDKKGILKFAEKIVPWYEDVITIDALLIKYKKSSGLSSNT